jgi:septal ring factor EnvC (AmiA/AmiB activator)
MGSKFVSHEPAKAELLCDEMDPAALYSLEEEHRVMIDIYYLASIARRALLICSLLIVGCFELLGQPSGPPGPPLDAPITQNDMDHGQSVDREVKQLTQRLALTDEQRSHVKALLTNQKQQIDALRRSMQTDLGKSDDKLEKMDELRDFTDTKIVALLNNSQKIKFAAWKHERRTAMERERQQLENDPPGQ